MNYNEAHDRIWDRQTFPEKGQPNCWIQWKGTSVCMDFSCSCGFRGHIDDDFVYYIHCPKCEKTYSCSGFIRLVDVTKEEAAALSKESIKVVTPEE